MNQGKPMLSFILDFPKALTAFARVKEVGAIKYDFDNWKRGGKPDREYIDAALRHMLAFKGGEHFADDSGCHHLAHATWNLFALLELNVDKVEDPKAFKGACDYWQMRRDCRPEATATMEDERAAIAAIFRDTVPKQ
jgi:hypothetical protein